MIEFVSIVQLQLDGGKMETALTKFIVGATDIKLKLLTDNITVISGDDITDILNRAASLHIAFVEAKTDAGFDMQRQILFQLYLYDAMGSNIGTVNIVFEKSALILLLD